MGTVIAVVTVAVFVGLVFGVSNAHPNNPRRRGGQARPRMAPPAFRSRPPMTSLPPASVPPLTTMPGDMPPGYELLDPNWEWELVSRPGQDDEWVKVACKHKYEPVTVDGLIVALLCAVCGKRINIAQ
jgi:hypothetical protein